MSGFGMQGWAARRPEYMHPPQGMRCTLVTQRSVQSEAKPETREIYDTVIVGGGPAGLSAALVLGRCLRRVIVCDAGHPRNEPAQVFNGYLSRDGSSPAEFLEISREQLRRYSTVELRRGTVAMVHRKEEQFTAVLESGERFSGRTLLLATGVVDELPDIENLREYYGKCVHSCPYCDGWEVRGQPIAVIGASQDAAELAIELLLWSPEMTLCTNGERESFDEKAAGDLQRFGVEVVSKRIVRLDGSAGELEGIRFEDGTRLERRAVFISPNQRQRSPLAEQLGCNFCESASEIRSESNTATSVPGVYAAGNCSSGIQLVIAAVAEGMRAAFEINNALLEADIAAGRVRRRTRG